MPTATIVRRTLIGALAGAAATAAIVSVRLVVSDAAPSSTTVPGATQVLQVEQYCRRLYPTTFLAAFPDTPSASGWVCQHFDASDALVTKKLGQGDMNEACRSQMSSDGSRAVALDERNPHSWRCTDPAAATSS